MKVVLVHGFNVRDGGARTVDTLAPTLSKLGYQIDLDEADYGWWGLLGIYLGNKKKVYDRLAGAFRDADLIITHSNGAAFSTATLNRMEEDEKKRTLVHLSPALDRDTPVPRNVTHQYVYHTVHDWAVRAATYLPFLPWGRMGAWGALAEERCTNEDWSGLITSHSGWFKYPRTFGVSAHLDYLRT